MSTLEELQQSVFALPDRMLPTVSLAVPRRRRRRAAVHLPGRGGVAPERLSSLAEEAITKSASHRCESARFRYVCRADWKVYENALNGGGDGNLPKESSSFREARPGGTFVLTNAAIVGVAHTEASCGTATSLASA